MNAPALLRQILRTPTAAGAGPAAANYSELLAEVRTALSSTRRRLADCSEDALPGRAVGSLGELQRATDHLRLAQRPANAQAHEALIRALLELQDDVADLARRGGVGGAILRSRGLEQAEHVLSTLAA
jgi:hypothetical protein